MRVLMSLAVTIIAEASASIWVASVITCPAWVRSEGSLSWLWIIAAQFWSWTAWLRTIAACSPIIVASICTRSQSTAGLSPEVMPKAATRCVPKNIPTINVIAAITNPIFFHVISNLLVFSFGFLRPCFGLLSL